MENIRQYAYSQDFEKQFLELLERHNLSKDDVITFINSSYELSNSKIEGHLRDYNDYFDSFIA